MNTSEVGTAAVPATARALSRRALLRETDLVAVPPVGWKESHPCRCPRRCVCRSCSARSLTDADGTSAAFTPTCSANHIPPFLKNYDAIKAKGVDAVYVVSCNDMFVQSAWGRVLHTSDKIAFLSDTSLTWLAAAGLTQDLSHVGFGAVRQFYSHLRSITDQVDRPRGPPDSLSLSTTSRWVPALARAPQAL